MDLPPLSEGNWLQRRYARWAKPHYDRMAPELRAEVERVDRWLYSSQGVWFWIVMLTGMGLSALALVLWIQLPWHVATVVSVLGWLTLLTSVGGAWLMPERFEWVGKVRWSQWAMAALLGLAGLITGYVVAKWLNGQLSGLDWLDVLVVLLRDGLMWVAGVAGFLALATGAVARLRRWRIETELRSLRLAAERDAAAREVAEARLRLLQAQIHPHFIFNTLSAVQHWVDAGDARASTLLRDLTAFLRGATEMLGQERTTLGEEVRMAGHYLSIMQARLGQRLTSRVDVPADLLGLEVPPGLLLTLVENAVEHGIEPALAGGCVNVSARADPGTREVTVRVHDDGVGLAPGWQDGVGLANCRQRLAHRFGASARVDLLPLERGTTALMRWPVPPLPGAAFPSGDSA